MVRVLINMYVYGGEVFVLYRELRRASVSDPEMIDWGQCVGRKVQFVKGARTLTFRVAGVDVRGLIPSVGGTIDADPIAAGEPISLDGVMNVIFINDSRGI